MLPGPTIHGMLWRVTLSLLVLADLTTGRLAAPTLTISHRARALQPGEVVVLTIDADTELSSVEVEAFGRVQRAQAMTQPGGQAHTWIAFVGIDLDVEPGRHLVSIAATSASGTAKATHPLLVTAKKFAIRRLSVDPNFVNPPASEAARIARETAALNAAMLGTAGPNPAPMLAFSPPVPHQANSAFGARSVFNGEPRNSHSGADFLSPTGTPIKAPAPGKVVLADNLYFSGGTVVVDHGLGVVSLFAHMSKILASVGDDVAQGTVLGLVGATGRVTGPHLHWTTRVNGARVDPLSLIALLPAK